MREYDAYELAYNNGKEYMRLCIINQLREMKGHALGVERFVLDEVIKVVERMVVRP